MQPSGYTRTMLHSPFSRHALGPVLCVCLIALCALCGGCQSQNGKGDVLTVSIPAQKWLLDSIVGDRFKVVSILGAESNPETFEPSMQQLMDLHNSAAYFTVGPLAFELASMPKVKENFPDLPIIETAKGIASLKGTHSMNAADGHCQDADPHVWSSLPNARVMAHNMYAKVIKLDPDGKDYYTPRYKKLDTNLAALHDSVDKALKPLKGRSFLVWHPSLSYFARDYGLTQIAMEQSGKEATVSQYKEQIDRARDSDPLIFITQAEFDSRQAQGMASELGIKTATVKLMQPDIASQIRLLTNELTTANH